MYTITKEFHFEAAHHLIGLPLGHQCARQHGHSYRVEVELQAKKLNNHGFVVDYGELDRFGEFLKTHFDHQDLNEVFKKILIFDLKPEVDNTTAENLAYIFYQYCRNNWPQTTAVRVSETAKTWAEYRP
jgi:6-pyruvoyltetrahydropterin/6-carboxytetrahydropterin synthase